MMSVCSLSSSDSPEEGRESGREGERKGGREGGKERGRKGGRERGREGGVNAMVSQQSTWPCNSHSIDETPASHTSHYYIITTHFSCTGMYAVHDVSLAWRLGRGRVCLAWRLGRGRVSLAWQLGRPALIIQE